MGRKITFLVMCHIDYRWKDKLGREWRKIVRGILKDTSSIISNLLGRTIVFEVAGTRHWRRPHIEKKQTEQKWEEVGHLYREQYPEYSEGESKDCMPLNCALDLLSDVVCRDFWDEDDVYMHIGFSAEVGKSGGGICSAYHPLLIVNHDPSSLEENIETLVHEVLHCFGAEHAEGGAMYPHYPADTSFLDARNKKRVFRYLGIK